MRHAARHQAALNLTSFVELELHLSLTTLRRCFAIAHSSAVIDLRLQLSQQTGVLPGLLNEIAHSKSHRLDRQINSGPGSHHDDGQLVIERMNSLDEIETFFSGGGVARVIEIH